MTDAIRTLIAIFDSRQKLVEAVDKLVELDLINIGRTAVIAKAADGETIVVNRAITQDEAGFAGGTFGAALTALGLTIVGGAGLVVAIGAGLLVGGLIGRQTGRFAANLMHFGFHEEQLKQFEYYLKEGQAALVIEVDTEQAVGHINDALTKLDAISVERVDNVQDVAI